MSLTYGSVCSGIESATVAWEALGFKAAWFSEIEPFPSAVLNFHWPAVPNLGDMTLLPQKVLAGEVDAPDIIVGGTPCQAFSVAGKCESLDDERGQLTLKYAELIDAVDNVRKRRSLPECIAVWENVPGVLNTKDNAFGCLLGKLAGESEPLQPSGKRWTNAGYVLGPKRAIAWRVLDAQYFGLAQRRKRVLLITSARNGFDPAAVLFEFDGLRRDIAPSRTAKQSAPRNAGISFKKTSHWDGLDNPHPTLNQSHNVGGIGASNQEVFSQRGAGLIPQTWPAEVAGTLGADFAAKQGIDDQHIKNGAPFFVADLTPFRMVGFGEYVVDNVGSTLLSRDAKDAKDAKDLVTVSVHGTQDPIVSYDRAHALGLNSGAENAIAIHQNQRGELHTSNISYPLATQGGIPGQGYQCIAFNPNQEGMGLSDVVPPIGASTGGNNQGCVTTPVKVRKLTPIECERLQGFPDNHTLIPVSLRKKIESDYYEYLLQRNPGLTAEDAQRLAKDGPRYKAIGNSKAVNKIRWVGQRIKDHVMALEQERAA